MGGDVTRFDTDRLLEDAYAAHAAPLERRLAALTRDAAAAEDIAQECFLRLATEVRAGRTPENIPAWLCRVGLNLVASRGRHQGVVGRRQGELPLPVAGPGPEAAALAAEDSRALRSALDALGATDRQALLLAAHGYRGPEIAARLGRSQGATRTLLCRARSKMRLELEATGFAG